MEWFNRRVKEKDLTQMHDAMLKGKLRTLRSLLMEAGCDEALQQIADKHYEDELKEDGYDHILKYGICFCKKKCRIKCEREI